jgi:ribose transport system permease protein
MEDKFKKLMVKAGPILGLLLVYAFFAFKAPADANFLSLLNTQTIITQTVIVAIGAIGMTLVIISGGIDLSAGSQIALSMVVSALMINVFAGPGTESVSWQIALPAALCGIMVCAFCGFLNGLISTTLKIVPFIVTLGMMQVARGFAKMLAKNQIVVTPENFLQRTMNVQPEPAWMLVAPGVWLMLILLVVMYVVLRHTVFGRHIYAIGSNAETARLCGIKVKTTRVIIYALCGAFLGIAGVMQYGNLNVGDPTAAIGMELDIIAAVVIGGGSLNGGEGGVFGSFVGALIMAVLRNGCTMLGLENYYQEIIIGVIIVSAVGIDFIKHKLSTSSGN